MNLNLTDWACLIAAGVCFVVALMIILVMSGCATQPVDNTSNGVITKTIASTDYLMTIFILGSAGCVFAGLNGLKIGWLGLGACLFGLVLKMALSVTWGYYVACIILICGVGIAVYSVVWKNKVVKSLIVGTQDLKEYFITDKEEKINANNLLMEAQGKVQPYVAAIKEKLFPSEDK